MLDEVMTPLHVSLENTKKYPTIITIFKSEKWVTYVLLLLLQLQ